MTYYVAVPRTAKPFRLASRITEDCRLLVNALMKKYGISEAAVIEQAVREYAASHGVNVERDTSLLTLPGGANVIHDAKPAYDARAGTPTDSTK
jgi:hypothetical protein